MTNRSVLTALLLAVLALLLAACGGNPTVADIAPLAKDRPTLLFFYTDT